MSCLNKSFMLLLFVVVSILPNKLVVSNKFHQKLTVSDSIYCDTISNIIDTNSIFKVNEGLLKGGLLYDVEKNKIIWGKNVQYHFEIASLTKMMVALIIIEDVRAGKINLNDRIKVPKEATLVGGSRVLLKSGSYQSIYNLLKASMIASGNDACYTLAYFGEASEKKFVDRMNIRAKRLNMNDTHFSNSTGMPARKGRKDNYSSPYDLLILSIELMKYTEILEISNMSKDNIHNGYRNITIHNHNRLVSKYSEFSGIKTGWTNKAGYCIVTKSDKSSKSLVCIVLGCSTSAIRNTIVTTLHNQYYEEIGINKLGD